MDFALDEQQRLLVSTVRAFIKRELAPLEDEIEATGSNCLRNCPMPSSDVRIVRDFRRPSEFQRSSTGIRPSTWSA